MTQNTPARRPGVEAKVGDIVQSQSGSNHALWKVEAIREVPIYGRGRTRARIMLDLRSLTSNRRDVRSTTWLDVLSPEEVARIQAKRAAKADYRVELIEALKGLLRARKNDKIRQECDPLFSTRANDAADAELTDDEIAKLEKRIAELEEVGA